MAFEKFIRNDIRLRRSICSINKNGILSISHGLRRECKLDSYQYCDMYFDSESRKIGIKLLMQRDEHSFKIVFHKTGASISVRSFVGNYSIVIKKIIKYDATWDAASGMITFGG